MGTGDGMRDAGCKFPRSAFLPSAFPQHIPNWPEEIAVMHHKRYVWYATECARPSLAALAEQNWIVRKKIASDYEFLDAFICIAYDICWVDHANFRNMGPRRVGLAKALALEPVLRLLAMIMLRKKTKVGSAI
jgi:hypothetical protein